jgi:hypothetical protein
MSIQLRLVAYAAGGLLTLGMLSCSSAEAPEKEGESSAASTESSPRSSSSPGPVATCAILTPDQIASAVGNPVLPGQGAGAGSCSWDTEKSGDVSVLLIVHQKGNIREPILCDELRKGGGSENVEGLDIAKWKFGSTLGLFNSGEFEGCGSKGFLSLQLNGERDEPTLKKATLAIVQLVLKRL